MKASFAGALLSCALFLLPLSGEALLAQERSELSQPPNGGNQKSEVSQWIGLVKVTITYHSPHVHNPPDNDRTGHIWGELVKYGFFDDGYGPSTAAPWRAGANETTTISFSHDVRIAGHQVRAGTYGLFLAVEPQGAWQWVLSTDASGWGAYQYDAAHDVARVPAEAQDAPFTEDLTFGFTDRGLGSATAFLQWEKKRVPLTIEVPDPYGVYVAAMRAELLSWPGFDYRNWQAAAQFCADHKINLEEALTWADKAIREPFRNATLGHEDFSTLQTKAAVLDALGRGSEADAVMERALALPKTDPMPVYRYGMSLLSAGRREKAMEVFLANRRLHPDEIFWTALGLARGYTATGDRRRAIASWETTLKNLPGPLENNRPAFEEILRKLRQPA